MLRQALASGESSFKNCSISGCDGCGIVCCGGSVRMIDVQLHSCNPLSILAQDAAKLSLSSCRITAAAACGVWARSGAVVLATGLQLQV